MNKNDQDTALFNSETASKKRLETDKDIYFLSADFGAAALDSLREMYPDNFVHCGISEQAMIDIATGLALQIGRAHV